MTRILANTNNIHQYSQFWCLKNRLLFHVVSISGTTKAFHTAGASVVASCLQLETI